VEQLAVGSTQYARQLFPLALAEAPELRLLLAFTVYCLTGVAAFLALSLRRPTPGIALMLPLIGFGFTVDSVPQVLRITVLFAVLAACWSCLAVSSAGTGAYTRRSRESRSERPAPCLPSSCWGRAVGRGRPWRDWRDWDPFHQGSSFYSFNWLQNYPELLKPANNVMIMKVQSPKPSYWRANALDSFTGEAWVSSQNFTGDIERQPQAVGFVYSIPGAEPVQTGDTVTERFRIRSVYTNYFFTGGDPRSLTLSQDVPLRMNDMRSLHVVNPLGPALDYTLEAVIPKITPKSLVGLGSDYPETLGRFLELPFLRAAQVEGPDRDAAWRRTLTDTPPDGWQWENLYSLNRAVIGQATDPYDIALRLERYLRQTYTYSLTPPPTDYSSPYAAFLFDTRAGYCQHFAGAMAMLLRFNGIPARVAVGFTSGEPGPPGVFTVATNNAHAWVETYFPAIGWVAFDPTPGRSLPNAGASSTSPGFVDPFADASSGETTVTTAFLPDIRRSPNDGPETSGGTGAGWLSAVPWLPWILGLLVLLAVWPTGRRLWRERDLRRGTVDQRFAASLRLLRASLSTYGVRAMESRTTEEAMDIVEAHLGLRPDPSLTSRAGAVLFGGRNASAEDIAQAEAFRGQVDAGLRKRHGHMRAILNLYGLPHLRPAKRAAREMYRAPDLGVTESRAGT
jgi:transglutaminase-like putative cysteine protease